MMSRHRPAQSICITEHISVRQPSSISSLLLHATARFAWHAACAMLVHPTVCYNPVASVHIAAAIDSAVPLGAALMLDDRVLKWRRFVLLPGIPLLGH